MKLFKKLVSMALACSLIIPANVITEAESGYTLANSTYFKDYYFREYLKANADTNKDQFLSQTEINNFTSIFIANDDNIEDISGIEYLTELKSVFIYNTCIESADLSKNNKLTDIQLYTSLIKSFTAPSSATSINIVQCTNLKTADFSLATGLTKLTLNQTNVKSLDLRKNNLIKVLEILNTHMKEAMFSSNSQLEIFHAYYCELSSIDLSNCSNLTSLHVENYPGTILSSFKAGKKLESLHLGNTSITSLNLKDYPNLTDLKITDSPDLTDFTYDYRPNFKNLILHNTAIKTLDLAYFPGLYELDLCSTPVKRINLSAASGIARLSLLDTRIWKINIAPGTALADVMKRGTCKYYKETPEFDHDYFEYTIFNESKHFRFEANIMLYQVSPENFKYY